MPIIVGVIHELYRFLAADYSLTTAVAALSVRNPL